MTDLIASKLLNKTRASKLLDCLDRIFFIPKLTPVGEPSFWIAIAFAILLFLASRTVVLTLFAARHFDLLTSDPGNYVALADFIREHGHLPNSDAIENRQFPGLALLMAAVNPLVGDTVLAGYVVSWLSSIGSVILFHALFRNFRLTLLFVIFVPSWIATSTLIMSEGLTFLLMLTAIWALHREASLSRRLLLLGLASFILVVRNTAVFFLIPFVAVWWWEQERKQFGWTRLLAYGLAAGAFPLAYLAWNWIALGELFPQYRSQLAYFIRTADSGYPQDVLAWPGQALLHGLGLDVIPFAKKMSVICSLVLGVGIVLRYFFHATGTVIRELAKPFAYASLLHLVFHLCIGGSFGFSSFDRYVSHINPILAKGIVGERQLRGFWIAFAASIGILFAGLTGHSPGATSFLPFLKP